MSSACVFKWHKNFIENVRMWKIINAGQPSSSKTLKEKINLIVGEDHKNTGYEY